jgi:hypothetical protein
MIKAALQYLHEMARPAYVAVDGRDYSGIELRPVKDPAPESLVVESLMGLVDHIESDLEEPMYSPVHTTTMIHVRDPKTVAWVTCLLPPWRVRHQIARAVMAKSGFPFDRFLDVEAFIIGVNADMQPNEDSQSVLNLVSRLTEASSRELKDNGLTQVTTVKKGLTQVAEIEVRNRVRLRPYRTFLEVGDQPESEFILRLRGGQDGALPSVALFEADGGAWRRDAMAKVKDWLVERLPGMVVVA